MNKDEPLAKALKVVRIGNSAGVILPKAILDRLGLSVGDSLSCHQTPDGINLVRQSETFDEQMAKARKLMKTYRIALRELAK